MEVTVLSRIRHNLVEKRRSLSSWLDAEEPARRQARLGPSSEQDVMEHLAGLDLAIQQAEEQTLGVCEICHEQIETSLLEMDYKCCVCLSHYSPEEISRLENELELAQLVQRALLPHEAPSIPGLQIAAYSRPSQILGGDYFDFVQFADGRYGLALADAAGHGMAAGLIMASIHTALNTLIPLSISPDDVLRHANHLYSRNVHFTTFVTIFLGAYNPEKASLTYSNAGHNPPLWIHCDGNHSVQTTWLKPTGAAVGLVDDLQISTGEIILQPGDTLLLYTDGVTEAMNAWGELFGPDRLVEAVASCAPIPPDELVHSVRDALLAFNGNQSLADDTTIVAVTRT